MVIVKNGPWPWRNEIVNSTDMNFRRDDQTSTRHLVAFSITRIVARAVGRSSGCGSGGSIGVVRVAVARAHTPRRLATAEAVNQTSLNDLGRFSLGGGLCGGCGGSGEISRRQSLLFNHGRGDCVFDGLSLYRLNEYKHRE